MRRNSSSRSPSAKSARGRPAPLGQAVEDYLTACQARGLSPKTVTLSYGYPLRSVFLPWAEREGLTDLAGLSSRVLERYAAHLRTAGGARGPLSESSIWTYVKAVRGLLAWLRAEGERVEGDVRLPRLGRRVVDVLSREEVQRLEGAARDERDKLIVRVLADTGVRVGELVRFRLDDLVQRDRETYMLVHGKGNRDRLVPLAPALARRLRRFGQIPGGADVVTDRLFTARRRDPAGERHALTESGVGQLVRDLGLRAEIGRRVHPHLFRHSAATYLLQRGMNPLLVAQVLGHSSLQMIQRTYAHLTPTDAHRALMDALRADDGGR